MNEPIQLMPNHWWLEKIAELPEDRCLPVLVSIIARLQKNVKDHEFDAAIVRAIAEHGRPTAPGEVY